MSLALEQPNKGKKHAPNKEKLKSKKDIGSSWIEAY